MDIYFFCISRTIRSSIEWDFYLRPVKIALLNRGRLTIYFLLLTIFSMMLFSCKSEKKSQQADTTMSVQKSRTDSVSSFFSLSCSMDPSNEQSELLRRLVAEIREATDSGAYCGINYKPLSICVPKDITPTCSFIFEDIALYLRNNQVRLRFCVSATNEWYAAVNTNSPEARIYVSTAFFDANEDEQKRSLIHELEHLQGDHTPHTDDKRKCEYFNNDALKAEHCLTCGVSFSPIVLSNCSTGTDGIFIIKK